MLRDAKFSGSALVRGRRDNNDAAFDKRLDTGRKTTAGEAEANNANENAPRRRPAHGKRPPAGGENSSPVHIRCGFIAPWSNLKGNKTMLSREFLGGSLASVVVAGAMLLAPVTAQAAMSPAPLGAYAASDVQNVGCLLGAHVGPLGACI